MIKALLLHVGADHSRETDMTLGISSPIFEDHKFEFIPILESWDLDWSENCYFLKNGEDIVVINDGKEYITSSDGEEIRIKYPANGFLATKESRTYASTLTMNQQYGKWLSEFIPGEYAKALIHSDPDFDNFTYGDQTRTSKGKQIQKLKEGDYIFFVASLAPYIKEAYDGNDIRRICFHQQGKMAKYVVGYFKISSSYFARKISSEINPHLFDPFSSGDDLSKSMTDSIDKQTLRRINNNAHSKRLEDDYFLLVGDLCEAHRLTKAIRLTKNGSPFKANSTGLELYGEKGFPRGWKWIKDEQKIQRLLDYCNSSV